MQTEQRESIPQAPVNEGAEQEQESYRRLTDDAKRVLRALVLLQSTGVAASPPERVRAAAVTLFDLPQSGWNGACRELITAGLVHLGVQSDTSMGGDRPEAPLIFSAPQTLVLEAIHEMLPGDLALPDLWLRLQEVLMRLHDAEALVALGRSYNACPWGNPKANQQHAVVCYHAALRIYSYDSTPIPWAMAQNDLGNAQATFAQLSTGIKQAYSLLQAVTAFEAALDVFTFTAEPTRWATLQSNLGNALRQSALAIRADGEPEEASSLLQEAMRHLRAVLEVLTLQAFPKRWAETQNNLGDALLAAASLSEAKERRHLLHEAERIYRKVLANCEVAEASSLWAATQNNLGSVLVQEASTIRGESRRRRLNEAVKAYHAALEVYTRDQMPLDWAMVQYNLGIALHGQADMAPDNTRLEILTQAVTAFTAALEVYTPEAAPADCAQIYFRLALLQRSRAALQASTHDALATLEQAKRNAELAIVRFHSIGDEARAYAAMTLSRQIEVGQNARGGGAEVRALIARGKELNAHQQYVEALTLLEEAVLHAPEQFDAWYEMGYSLGNLTRYTDALVAFERASKIDPEAADPLYNQGLALNCLGRSQEALEMLERALALNPKYADAWCEKARALGDLEQHEEALAACERAIALRPHIALAILRKGNELDILGRSEEAIRTYEEVLAKCPNDVSVCTHAWENQGRIFHRLNRIDKAISAFDLAIALDPQDHWAWNAEGNVYLERGQYAEAMRCIDQAVELAPNEAAYWDSRGEILLALQQYEEALTAFNHAISLSEKAGFAWRNKAKALRALGREVEAGESAQRAKELGFA